MLDVERDGLTRRICICVCAYRENQNPAILSDVASLVERLQRLDMTDCLSMQAEAVQQIINDLVDDDAEPQKE